MCAHGTSNQEHADLLSMTHKSQDIFEVMFCWNAAGKGDIVSKWTRSVSFIEVVRFYDFIRRKFNSNVEIVDISNWNDWESRKIKSYGITTINPRKVIYILLQSWSTKVTV